MRRPWIEGMIFNVLVKQLGDEYVAHCLDLDIVTTSKDEDKVMKDISDLIGVQVGYAFSNDNLDYLYRPAPSEVWQEFYSCKEQIEKKIAEANPIYYINWLIKAIDNNNKNVKL